ncbi:MAG: hypothetical protein ACE5KH_00690 [Candidatus Geothermarchaeales archaeon]
MPEKTVLKIEVEETDKGYRVVYEGPKEYVEGLRKGWAGTCCGPICCIPVSYTEGKED